MAHDIKQLAALTALNDMFQKGYISICAIDTIGELLGINPKCSESYKVLRTLHCVNFDKMPAELRDQLPSLVMDCVAIEPTFQFKTIAVALPPAAEEPKQPRRRCGGLLSWIN